ncbi:MAG: ATP phosphoribosyltransferase regulatory subunit [Clostridium sp.]
MDKTKGFIPDGVEDINSLEFGMKDRVIEDINRVFRSFGYKQILTPTFEYYDLFNDIEGTIAPEEMFKFIDRHGKILVLRPDVTIPIARMGLASYKQKKEAVKFSYSTSVYRMQSGENAGKAEFIQSGVEFLGESEIDADAEAIVIAIKSLLECGFKDFKIDIGEASYFKALIDETKLTILEINDIKKYIEAKNFTGLEFYLEGINIEEKTKNVFLKLPMLYGKVDNVAQKAKDLCLNEKMEKAIESLLRIYEAVKEYGFEKYILADLGLVSHINYYTGLVFKGYVNRYGKEVLGGGRYDNLTKSYGEYMPSTGFAINIDSVIDAMKVNSLFANEVEGIDYGILYTNENRKEAIRAATILRDRGYTVDTRKINNNESSMQGYKKVILIKDKIYTKQEDGNNIYDNIKEFLKDI